MKKIITIVVSLIIVFLLIAAIRFFININYHMCMASYESHTKAIEVCSDRKKL